MRQRKYELHDRILGAEKTSCPLHTKTDIRVRKGLPISTVPHHITTGLPLKEDMPDANTGKRPTFDWFINTLSAKFRRKKVSKFRVGAENFLRQKIFSAENFVR